MIECPFINKVLQVRVSWQSPKKLKCFWKSFDSENNCVNVPIENYFEFIIFYFLNLHEFLEL